MIDGSTLRQLGDLGIFVGLGWDQRRGGSEDPWLCGTGFHRLCLFEVLLGRYADAGCVRTALRGGTK